MAFATARFMHKEYGSQSIWYSVSAYSVAAATGALCIAKDNHWASDVPAGAGLGILSTELVYWAYPTLQRTARNPRGDGRAWWRAEYSGPGRRKPTQHL
jgi:hypothetical protein